MGVEDGLSFHPYPLPLLRTSHVWIFGQQSPLQEKIYPVFGIAACGDQGFWSLCHL